MANRNVPGISSPHQSSSSPGPLAGTTGSGSVRSRNRRLPNNGSSRTNSESLLGSHDEITHPAPRSAQNAKGKQSSPGLGQVFGGSWAQSWSSVQGLAASLLSVADNPGDTPQLRSHTQPEDSFASSLWNRIPSSVGGNANTSFKAMGSSILPSQRAANRVATGSSDQRDAALKTAKRASVLENNQGFGGGVDISGRYKRRTSDEITSENSQPEEYLVYIHKILPTDTYAGIILRYKCLEDAFRKANGLWSRDSIQVRKWVIIPVDACEVRGRPCDPPLDNQQHNATGFPPATSSVISVAVTPETNSSSYSKSFSERAGQDDENTEREVMPWSHVKWVKIDSLSEPVEIGRIARQKMGYFPPRRKKTGRTVSFSSSPRQSLETSTYSADQVEQPLSRRQSLIGDRPPLLERRQSTHSHGDDDVLGARPAWMRRPGGVGSMGRNVRAPGPDKDYFNSWAKKHLPGLHMDDLPSMSVMGSEMARIGFDRDLAGIVEGSFEEGGDTTSPLHQNNGLDKAAAAVETWLRTAWSKRHMAPLIGSTPRPESSGGQDIGDLIELMDTPGAEDTPRPNIFDSQVPSSSLGSKTDDDSSIKR
ncbi:carbohydrate-binding module family 50 protein [Trichoderma evansii]